ncbi:MAG: hypothetical protein ACOC6L_00250 [Thermodesulfobacteriota bacterium]
MRLASGEFLQEERLLRGASPRVKAVLFPFELEYGLGPGSGTFEYTQYGGEPGKLELEEGYSTSGSWTSPVMQTFSSYLDTVLASWEDHAGYLEARVFLRGAAAADQVTGADYTQITPQKEFPLFPFFQVRVEFLATDRSWAVEDSGDADGFTAYAVDYPGDAYDSQTGEGDFPAYISGLSFEGRLTVPESEILNPGEVQVELTRDFAGLKSGSHVLGMDNRESQWLPNGGSFYFLGLPWAEKRLALYHGFELPNGRVEWLLLYQGTLSRLGGMADGWQERHRVELETIDWITHCLNRRLGAPTPEGERQPFMRGFYRSRAELGEVAAAEVSTPMKSGSGSATLQVLGNYRGDVATNYLLRIETTGEVGVATFRWSITGGQSWEKTGLICGGADNPVTLSQGLSVYWQPGIGDDLVAWDSFTFTASPPVYGYQVFGAPFEAISAIYLNGEETWEDVSADPQTGVITVTGRSAQVSARVVKDGTTHPVDIMLDILTEVGLSDAVHHDSFELAKSLTPEYAVGVCFENIPASQALRELLRRTLYDLWVDFGEIKIRAYLGED